jgi:hypothetical protein
VTGRSGGGAYSWWVSALDDRIKVSAPVAGMTDLQNYVVDGTVEGHCDCMFMVNTFRWDYPTVAALVAPRPLLIGNSDKDSIFPLNGVVRLHEKVARIYELYGAANNLGLLITEGPHHDTQDLQVPVFRWFNRHLKGEDPLIEMAAKPLSSARDLRVFDALPGDERTSRIHDTFVAAAPPAKVPENSADWHSQRDAWKNILRTRVFRGWPEHSSRITLAPRVQEVRNNRQFDVYEFNSQDHVPLRLYVLQTLHAEPKRLQLKVIDQAEWADWVRSMRALFPDALQDELNALDAPGSSAAPQQPLAEGDDVQVWLAPRGVGLGAWTQNPRKLVQIRRRFMLLGQTLDSMRVWDVRCGIQAARLLPERLGKLPISLRADGAMGVNTLYAVLFEPEVNELEVTRIPESHCYGPDYLNVLRFMDIPQAVAMVADTTSVRLQAAAAEAWNYPIAIGALAGWPAGRLRILP